MNKLRNIIIMLIMAQVTQIFSMENADSNASNSYYSNRESLDKKDKENNIANSKIKRLKESLFKYGTLSAEAGILGFSVFGVIGCSADFIYNDNDKALNLNFAIVFSNTIMQILKKWITKYNNIETNKKSERITNFSFLIKNGLTVGNGFLLCHLISRLYNARISDTDFIFSTAGLITNLYSLNIIKNELLPEYKHKFRSIRDKLSNRSQNITK